MSPITFNAQKRRKIIQDNLLFHTYQELAELCHCSKRTIVRDINKWKDDGGFNEFLIKEFLELYSMEKRQKPSRALDRVMLFLTKQQTKAEQEHYDDVFVKWIKNEANVNA